jgi:hypothetical protein
MWVFFPKFASYIRDLVGIDLVKMKKLGKKKAFISSWEGPYLFVGYVN